MGNEFFGSGSIKHLDEILKAQAPDNVLVVSGKRSYELSGAKKELESRLGGIANSRYSDFSENPKFEDMLKGAEIVKKYNPDLIIAIGGGSVIDTAKIISVLPDKIARAKKMIRGEIAVSDKIAPLVAIPTTSGSGSEATHFAVAYLNNAKYSVASDQLLPDYVILDPQLTYSMSPNQTAVSGLDALCQGIESFWAKGANDQSIAFAEKAIKLILNNIEKAVNHPTPAVRLKMTKGANLAGKAINISKTTAPHAISYALTTFYGIPHGHAVALTLGEFFVFNTVEASKQSNEKLSDRMCKLFELLGCIDAGSCRVTFHQLMKNIKLETKLGEIISGNIDIQKIVNKVNTQRLSNHPVSISKKELYDLIISIL